MQPCPFRMRPICGMITASFCDDDQIRSRRGILVRSDSIGAEISWPVCWSLSKGVFPGTRKPTMSSKSQRKRDRQARNRKERQKRQERLRNQQPVFRRPEDQTVGSNSRHRQRLAEQIPRSWPGELSEDVAVFDDAALSALPPELAQQATAVREALREVLESRGDDGLKRVAVVPRGSSFSEWRLFLRGLVDWLANEWDSASETWQRLDPERRPGRIATAMMVALRSDLESAASPQVPPQTQEAGVEGGAGPAVGSVTEPAANPLADEDRSDAASGPATEPGTAPDAGGKKSPWDQFDETQLYHAKLLRRVRFDRAALRIAEAALSVPEESQELVLGPKRIAWLQRFIAEYQDTEPELTAALAEAGLARAVSQSYYNLFDDAVRVLRGPRHDRRNWLLRYFYYGRFANDRDSEKRAERALHEYLQRDLPQNKEISDVLRSAIVSQLHLKQAVDLMGPPRTGTIFDWIMQARQDPREIEDHLRSAVKAAPTNRRAYEVHAEWIMDKLDEDRLSKVDEEEFEEDLEEVMQTWSHALPDDVKPRLWLVDYLLENEHLEEARPHVEFLAASRHEDPRVRATSWKWQLLEAMRLCRRKAWLREVPAFLDEAEKLWPAWLSPAWLPYLRTAWMLRLGRGEAYADERRRIREETGRGLLADACMALGAAQKMRVAAADLKPLRAAADQAIKDIDQLPLEDLVETASFFWDLHRVQLVYPAHRMQSKPIGTALLSRLGRQPEFVADKIDDIRTGQAVLWMSECRFWASGYATKIPAIFNLPAIGEHPFIVAAKVNAFLGSRYYWGYKKFSHLLSPLRAAATATRDAYYRYWFAELAARLDDAISSAKTGFSTSPLGNLFGDLGDEDDDADDEDDDNDGLDFDPNCNCPDCRAARAAYDSAAKSKSK